MKEYIVRVYENRTEWHNKGDLHREDGPAVEWSNRDKEWWFNGKRHREDGPAVEWNNGKKFWWLNGKEYTEEEFNKIKSFNGKIVEIDGKKYKLMEV